MTARAIITSKGQITLPKEVRSRHGWKVGDTVEFVEEGTRTYVQARTSRISDLAGMLGQPPSGAGLAIEEFDNAIMDAVAEEWESLEERVKEERPRNKQS